MGALGSDAAIEAADVVLMTDEPSKISVVMKIARKTLRIAHQNIVFALAVKFLVLGLGALGYASMWAAVFAAAPLFLDAAHQTAEALALPVNEAEAEGSLRYLYRVCELPADASEIF